MTIELAILVHSVSLWHNKLKCAYTNCRFVALVIYRLDGNVLLEY
jgi:hypothetical protein